MTQNAEYWIETLKLKKHPEGGYFRETYKSEEEAAKDALPQRFGGPRPFSTAIYYLLPHDAFSCFHRIQSDEIWHFYAGNTIGIHIIHPDGKYECREIGPETGAFQCVVPKNTWFGAKLKAASGYALVGCTVSPGFAFEDFETADRKTLLSLYPQHETVIKELTHDT